MSLKTVEMVRKIRDKHYEETKGLSIAEQITFVKKKSGKLQKEFKSYRSTTGNRLVGSSR